MYHAGIEVKPDDYLRVSVHHSACVHIVEVVRKMEDNCDVLVEYFQSAYLAQQHAQHLIEAKWGKK